MICGRTNNEKKQKKTSVFIFFSFSSTHIIYSIFKTIILKDLECRKTRAANQGKNFESTIQFYRSHLFTIRSSKTGLDFYDPMYLLKQRLMQELDFEEDDETLNEPIDFNDFKIDLSKYEEAEVMPKDPIENVSSDSSDEDHYYNKDKDFFKQNPNFEPGAKRPKPVTRPTRSVLRVNAFKTKPPSMPQPNDGSKFIGKYHPKLPRKLFEQDLNKSAEENLNFKKKKLME